jgi:hypothetical protein
LHSTNKSASCEIENSLLKEEDLCKADQGGLLREGLQELLQQLICIVNALCILPYDPDHAGLGLRLVQSVQVLTQSGNDALIPVPQTQDWSKLLVSVCNKQTDLQSVWLLLTHIFTAPHILVLAVVSCWDVRLASALNLLLVMEQLITGPETQPAKQGGLLETAAHVLTCWGIS